jgi:uncharacterized protein (TIGR03083 family)
MPLHPSPPDDLGGLLDALEQTTQAIVDLGWACREEDFERETELQGWTVKDHISYVVAAGKAFATLRNEPALAEQRRAQFDELVALDVTARRQWAGRSVVSELADFQPERMKQLRESGLELDSDVAHFFGPGATFGSQLHQRIIDTWVHEQDIRAALDRPGDLDSPAAAVFTAAILAALPRVAARAAGVEPGRAIVLDVTGPVMARGGVRVIHGEDGRPYGDALFSGLDRPEGDEQHDVTTVQLTTEALTRRAAGRRTTDEIHFTVTGDEAAAKHLLDALALLEPQSSPQA